MDEARSHLVEADLCAPGRFRVREYPLPLGAPEEAYERSHSWETAWEAGLLRWELETRLALAGRYWGQAVGRPGWWRVRSRLDLPPLDLRPVDPAVHEGPARWHHFHDRETRLDELLVAIPRQRRAQRFALLSARVEFPHIEAATLDLVHPALHPSLLRSLLARAHLDHRGWSKLVRPKDFELAHGPAWRRMVDDCYQETLARVTAGRLGAPAKDEQDSEAAWLKSEALRWLHHPKLLSLHERYLYENEEETLVSGGPVTIRRAIQQKRRKASAEEQLMLTLLEASLMARHGLRSGIESIDAEAAALIRRVAYYI